MSELVKINTSEVMTPNIGERFTLSQLPFTHLGVGIATSSLDKRQSHSHIIRVYNPTSSIATVKGNTSVTSSIVLPTSKGYFYTDLNYIQELLRDLSHPFCRDWEREDLPSTSGMAVETVDVYQPLVLDAVTSYVYLGKRQIAIGQNYDAYPFLLSEKGQLFACSQVAVGKYDILLPNGKSITDLAFDNRRYLNGQLPADTGTNAVILGRELSIPMMRNNGNDPQPIISLLLESSLA